MKRRLIGMVFVLLMLVGGLTYATDNAVYAVEDPDTGTAGHAQYYPEDTVIFASLVIDEAYIAQLNQVIRLFTTIGNEFGVPNVTLEQGLTLASGVNAQNVLAWLGETASLGLTVDMAAMEEGPNFMRVVIDIADREAAKEFIEDMFGPPTGGDDTLYPIDPDVALILLDDRMVINVSVQPQDEPLRTVDLDGPTLADNADFQTALANMSAPSYNILLYLTPQIVMDASGTMDDMPPAAMDVFTPQMYGASILDDNTFVLDGAVLPLDAASAAGIRPVNPEFTRYIPASAASVVHATDFTALYYGIFDFAASMNTEENFEDPRPMIEAGLAEAGIDLQADILDWTTGDYALFMRGDLETIASEAFYSTGNFEDTFGFGLVMEATNPASAQRFAGKISTLMQQAATETDEFEAATVDVNGLSLTSIMVDIPLGDTVFGSSDQSLIVEMLMGATDDVFFFATRNAAEEILAQAASLGELAVYQDASAYFLPEPSSIWYTDGEGFLLSTVANPVTVLALLGPATSEVFTEIVQSLDTTPMPTPVPTPTPPPTPTPDPAELDQVLRPLNAVIDTIVSSSITTAVTGDGVTLLRAAITLNLDAR